MKNLVYGRAADKDLYSIALHIGETSIERGKALVERIRRRAEILRAHPEVGRARPELGDGIRSLIERPYVLLYRISDEDVEIVAVLHGARDLPSALKARLNAEHDS